MKTRHIIAIVFPFLFACPFLLCLALIGVFLGQSLMAYTLDQARLALVVQALPVADKSVLVLSIEGQADGGTEGCLAFQNLQVYGSNDMTLADVLNFYSSKLHANSWKDGNSGSNWRSFWLGDKEFVLSISDDTDLKYEDLMYRDGNFNANRAKVDDARKQFKTIYVLSLTGGDMNPTVRKQCQ